MSFELSGSLWTPQRRGLDETISLLESGKDVCLYAPTGGGKTTQAYELFRYCQHYGMSGAFYVNRKLLIGQTAERFRTGGLDVGVRAADYDDEFNPSAQFQICSADTERSRVLKSGLWGFSDAQLVVIDECFPSGTMVDGRAIESIKPGDSVTCFNHSSNSMDRSFVEAVSSSYTRSICLVKMSSGRQLPCTPGHPFWSESRSSYIAASDLRSGEAVFYGAENPKISCLRNLREGVPVSEVKYKAALQRGVCIKVKAGVNLRQSVSARISLKENDGKEPNAKPGSKGSRLSVTKGNRPQAIGSRRKRTRCNRAAEQAFPCTRRWLDSGTCDSNKMPEIEASLPHMLQAGHSEPRAKNSRRGGRRIAQFTQKARDGLKENCVPGVDWVDSVEVYEQGSGPEFDRLCPGGRVFNLQVAKHSNYFAGGYLVHNCHIQKTETMEKIIAHYHHRGARIVGLTATPVGLSSWFDELVVSGRIREYHDCKALVPAYVYGIQEPDMRKVKRNLTGEFVLDGKKTKIYVQSIVADVLSSWKRLNPDARPTMLFAPGKDESVWFTEQFEKLGVSWCHVDATDAVLKGKRYRLNRNLWLEIQDMYRSGEIRGLSSRFKLREGVDLPCTYHTILATPIGSLASYIQTVGRALRYSPETPDKVIIQDHGGNYHRLGSPNQDRPWKDYWRLPEHAVSNQLQDAIKDGKEKEPIRCPKCGLERMSGVTCPACGFTHTKGSRNVIMEDGSLREIEGPMVRPRRVRLTSDTQEKWSKLYFAYRRKGLDKSFKQMLGFFVHEHGYHPPMNLDYMPKNDWDWYAKVKNIGPELLRDSKREYSERELFRT